MKRPKIENLGLKLLALILAVVIYHVLKQESASLPDVHDRPLFQYR